MDSECAKVESNEMMMKKEGAKNATQCTLTCVKMGGKYVLFNAAEKAVYQLDDQKRPEQFAGEKVTVTGPTTRTPIPSILATFNPRFDRILACQDERMKRTYRPVSIEERLVEPGRNGGSRSS